MFSQNWIRNIFVVVHNDDDDDDVGFVGVLSQKPFKFGHNPDSNRRNIVVVVVDPTNLSLKLG